MRFWLASTWTENHGFGLQTMYKTAVKHALSSNYISTYTKNFLH